MAPWAETLLIIALVIFVIYSIGAIVTGGSMVKSLPVPKSAVVDADQIYYLPTAMLLVRATAKVIVTRNEATTIIAAKLAELALDTTVQTVPDTEASFTIKYLASPFATDDLKFSISASGLLEGINLTAEDRIAGILTQITDAPKLILTGEQAAAAGTLSAVTEATDQGETVITETREYTNTFYILTEEIRNGTASRPWTINVDGTAKGETTADASFSLTFTPAAPNVTRFTSLPAKGTDGLLMRPLRTVGMEVKTGSNAPTGTHYQILIPDESRVVAVPVTRSAFVKKTYGFKLTNGVFTENTINKPSEMEGFIGIPIAVARAIVSIPARLLHFKVENIKRQTSLETEEQKLAKALLDTRKNEISKNTELVKASLEAEKTLLVAQKDIVTANKELDTAKKDWENAKKELEELLKKVEEAKRPA